MEEKTKQEKINRFLKDRVMAEVIYGELLKSFLKKRKWEDVNLTAAARMAIDFLEDAWREMEKYKSQDEGEKVVAKQVGL